MYTVASPDTDPNPRGGGQLPNPRVQFYANECNEGRDALRVQFYANEWNWWERNPHVYHIYCGRGSTTLP